MSYMALIWLFLHNQLLLSPHDHDFHMTASVVECFEDGPAIIQVEMKYTGKRILKTHSFYNMQSRAFNVSVDKVPTWNQRERVILVNDGIITGYIAPEATVTPGDKFKTLLYLHHDYSRIPVGKERLRLRVMIFAPFDMQVKPPTQPRSRQLLAHVTTELEVFVQKSTKERREHIKAEIEKDLLLSGEPEDEPTWELRDKAEKRHRTARQRLLWIEHKDFALLAIKVLTQLPPSHGGTGDLRRYIYFWSRHSEDVHTALVRYLFRHGSRNDNIFLAQWEWDKVQLSEKDLELLHRANHPWIRASSYLLVPEEKRPVERLREEVDALRALIESLEKHTDKPSP